MHQGQSTKELMQVLKEKHKIEVSASKHEDTLLRMGYFHGFKGYRFLKQPDKLIPYGHFDEVIGVYQFDTKLKALLYPQIMFIETALKNVTLDTLIRDGSANFDHIYRSLLNDYEKHPPASGAYKRKMKSRLDLRTRIYRSIAYNYTSNNPMVEHFLNDGRSVPLWTIFEMINLGDFGLFLHCLNVDSRIAIMQKIKMHHIKHNENGRVLEDMISVLRNLRNAVAHNTAVFDCRYRKGNPPNRLMQFLQVETSVKRITFERIVDDIILIAYLMKKLGISGEVVEVFVSDFTASIQALKREVPNEIFALIAGGDIEQKMIQLIEGIN